MNQNDIAMADEGERWLLSNELENYFPQVLRAIATDLSENTVKLLDTYASRYVSRSLWYRVRKHSSGTDDYWRSCI